jgi:hypothetical protein
VRQSRRTFAVSARRPLRLATRVRARPGNKLPEDDDVYAVRGDVAWASLRARLGVVLAIGTGSQRLPGVGAEHLHEHPRRKDRGDRQQAVAEEGIQADGLA